MAEPPDTDITGVWSGHRAYLLDLAFRMLGNIHDAEDVVQEAFGRLLRLDLDEIDDVRGWLVVVVSRLCLDQLRSARNRYSSKAPLSDDIASTPRERGVAADPADVVTLDDSIRMALLVVLQRLSPAERTAFVLHDVFQLSFDDISAVVGRSPAACRQLASRARRRIEDGSAPARFDTDVAEHHRVTERFIAACAGGDLETLLELLDENAGGDVDLGPGLSPRPPILGRARIARNLLALFGPQSGMTLVSQPVNGNPGLLAFHDRVLWGIIELQVRNDLVVDLHAVADPAKLAFVTLQMPGSGSVPHG